MTKLVHAGLRRRNRQWPLVLGYMKKFCSRDVFDTAMTQAVVSSGRGKLMFTQKPAVESFVYPPTGMAPGGVPMS